jgi:hypothetical protein
MKKAIRLLINEIVVNLVGDHITMIIHSQGGDPRRQKEQGRVDPGDGADGIDLVWRVSPPYAGLHHRCIVNRSSKSTGRGKS